MRLVLLDEPFRGLDREQRRELLARARRLWQGATLLCVTHDVGETLGFARVLVVENGRIVEDGPPERLAAEPGLALRGAPRRRAGRAVGALAERGLAAAADGARAVDRGGRRVSARLDLDTLAWPADRLAEALSALARAAGLGAAKLDLPAPPPDAVPEELDRWIGAAAAAMGLEAEPVEAAYGEVAALVGHAAPALLRLPGTAGGFLALLAGGRRQVKVLGRDHRPRRVAVAALRDALRGDLDAGLGPEVDRLLDEAAVPPRRRERAREALLAERLAERRIGGCWLLDLPPGGSFWAAARRAGLPGRGAVLVGAHMAQHALLLLSWWVLGLGVLRGRLDPAWVAAWVLLQLTVIPFRALELWSAGVLMARAGRLFKRRLLVGALRMAPEETRHQGAGQLLGRILNAEALEFLALTGAHVGVIAFAEVLLALPVLAAGAGGWPHALLLLAWVAFALWLGWRYLGQRRVWTAARLEMTHDLVEQMVGHRTRLAQQSAARWHEREDGELERYLDLSAELDRRAALLRVLVPRGWLLVSLLALARPFIAGTASSGSLAVALGGALFAYWALWKLVRGLADLCGGGRRVGPGGADLPRRRAFGGRRRRGRRSSRSPRLAPAAGARGARGARPRLPLRRARRPRRRRRLTGVRAGRAAAARRAVGRRQVDARLAAHRPARCRSRVCCCSTAWTGTPSAPTGGGGGRWRRRSSRRTTS